MLSVENLSLSVSGHQILKELNLSIPKGEITALLGGSGSGKTTLLKGLFFPRESGIQKFGKILWDGGERENLQKSPCQVVFQDPHSAFSPFFTMRILLEEIHWIQNPWQIGRKNKSLEKKTWELMERFHLDVSLLDRKISELSGGQLQRFAIVRALLLDPQILFLDEPVTALDLVVQHEIALSFLEWKKTGLGFFLISHDLDLVRSIADRVYVLHKGTIVESGKNPAIFQNPKTEALQNLVSARILSQKV